MDDNVTLLRNPANVYKHTSMNSRSIISAIKADGWYHVETHGSHHQFKHATKKGRVTVPHPEKDIPLGTLKSIERQSGIKLRP